MDPREKAPVGYRLAQSIELSDEEDGVTGGIQLLEDDRLTPSIREKWKGMDSATACEGPSDPELVSLCRSVGDRPLLPVVIRLRDPRGAILDQRRFEREIGALATAHLSDPTRRTVMVTIDYGVGFGSYAGETTFLAEPRDKHLSWLAAGDSSGNVSEIRLTRTLKSAWKTVRRVDGLADVMTVQCEPDLRGSQAAHAGDKVPFIVRYGRYTFAGQRWIRRERSEPGFWENEGRFPAREKFP